MNLKINELGPYGYKYNMRFHYYNYISENELEWNFNDSKKNKKIKIELIDAVEIEKLGGYLNVLFNINNDIDTSRCFYIIYLPLSYFFINLNKKEVLEILAILEKEALPTKFEYFEVGESYGFSEKTIVKKEKTIIKSFNLIYEEKLFTINEFYVYYKKNKVKNEIQTIVEEYIEKLNFRQREIEIQEYNNLSYRNNRSDFSDDSSSYDNEHYNDQLDMDQQSPEFWDNL